MLLEVNLSNEEYDLLQYRANKNHIGVSEYMRRAMLEKLENDEDIEFANAIIEDDDEPISHEEFMKELGA